MKELYNPSNVGGFVDMEIADDSPFIPLSVFMHSLRGEKSIDLGFIKTKQEKHLEDMFFPSNKAHKRISV